MAVAGLVPGPHRFEVLAGGDADPELAARCLGVLVLAVGGSPAPASGHVQRFAVSVFGVLRDPGSGVSGAADNPVMGGPGARG